MELLELGTTDIPEGITADKGVFWGDANKEMELCAADGFESPAIGGSEFRDGVENGEPDGPRNSGRIVRILFGLELLDGTEINEGALRFFTSFFGVTMGATSCISSL